MLTIEGQKYWEQMMLKMKEKEKKKPVSVPVEEINVSMEEEIPETQTVTIEIPKDFPLALTKVLKQNFQNMVTSIQVN